LGANVPIADIAGVARAEPVDVLAPDGARRHAVLYEPLSGRARVALHLMHPKTDQSRNYLLPALLGAGYAVLAGGSRWVHNDTATVHERLVLDVAGGVRLLRERGYSTVALVGNSGGGTLAAFYQSQAERAGERLTETPAGDRLDLNAYDLPAADAVALVGAHRGEGQVLRRWIDPSVLDEQDPYAVDAGLDMYDPANGFRCPPGASRYDPDFVVRYRAAQDRRVRRLDELARAAVERRREARRSLRSAGPADRLGLERAAATGALLTISRTEADPAFLDLALEPDDRPLGSPLSLRPDLANVSSAGFARVVTPQAWLSTWSATATNADTARCLAQLAAPLLVVHYAGDGFTKRAQMREAFDLASSPDKTYHEVGNVDHYGFTIVDAAHRGPRSPESAELLIEWLRGRLRV